MIMSKNIIDIVTRALIIESEAIIGLISNLEDSVVHVVQTILLCKGRIVITGMGKSGHISRKIAATFASTGTPAFFMHPAEASHGDLGMLTKQDVVLALSNSGETSEIILILPLIKRLGANLICMTGNPNSTIALAADIHLNVAVAQEACPLNLAPTASTTAALALGDALAVAVLQARGFTAEDFATTHPSGRLGKRLLVYVRDIMHCDEDLPVVHANASFKEVLLEITNKKLGMTAVLDDRDQLVGVFTDGDLRRCLDGDLNISTSFWGQSMSVNPKLISEDVLAVEAVRLMEEYRINGLLVVDATGRLKGALNMHDLMLAGVV
jgi:arabinose-5-phosphate isomerase